MPTTTRAAVLWGHHEDWKIEDVELDVPGPIRRALFHFAGQFVQRAQATRHCNP